MVSISSCVSGKEPVRRCQSATMARMIGNMGFRVG
jgi:hypothetical protein